MRKLFFAAIALSAALIGGGVGAHHGHRTPLPTATSPSGVSGPSATTGPSGGTRTAVTAVPATSGSKTVTAPVAAPGQSTPNVARAATPAATSRPASATTSAPRTANPPPKTTAASTVPATTIPATTASSSPPAKPAVTNFAPWTTDRTYGAAFNYTGPTPTGTVTVTVNGQTVATETVGPSAVRNGNQMWVGPFSWQGPGTYTLSASYSGDSRYRSAVSPSITVAVADR